MHKNNLIKLSLLIVLLLTLSFILFKNKNAYSNFADKIINKFKKQEFKSLSETYHILPDKRLINAINDIEIFFNKKINLNVKYINNQWEINKKYTLSKYPNFEEFMQIYKKILKTKAKFKSSKIKDIDKISEQINSLNPKLIFNALENIQTQWKTNKSSKLLKLTLKSYINLLAINNDKFNLIDNIQTKAISILAILKFRTQENTIKEEAILSYLLGYSSTSEAILKEKNTYSYYLVTNNIKKLKTIDKNSNLEKALFINLLAERLQSEEVLQESQKYFPNNYLLLTNFIFRLNGFREVQKFSVLFPYLLLLNLNNNKTKDYKSFINQNKGKNPYNLISKSLKNTKIQNGNIINKKLYTCYYESLAYNSLYENFNFYIEKLSSYNISHIITMLKTSNLTLSEDFINYFKFIKSIKEGKTNDISKIINFNYINNAFFIHVLDDYTTVSTYGSIRGVGILKTGLKYLDTRTSDKIFIQKLLRYSLLDLIYWEELVLSIINTDKYNNGYYRLWYAFAQNDMTKFNKLLQKNTISSYDKASALRVFGEKIYNKKQIIQSFDKIINESNLRWEILSKFTEFLQKSNEDDKAIQYLKIALLNKNNQYGLTKIFIKTAIARKYFHKKEYKTALKIIEPLINSYQAGAMQRAIETLIKLKNYKRAEAIAKRLISRYPYLLWARVTFAKIYWNSGKYKKAAKVIKDYPSSIDTMLWHSKIAPEFSDVFKGKDKNSALKAFMALKKEGFSVLNLDAIIDNISYDFKRNDIAFLLSTKISFNGFGRFTSILNSYRYLKAWKNKEIAFKWLYPQIPKNLYDFFALITFGAAQYDLLWKFKIAPNVKLRAESGIWLARASAYLLTKEQTHKKELIAHYKNTEDNYYDKIGAYLMNLKTENEIISLIDNNKKRCEIAYYIAIKAEVEKKYRKASKWYHISILTGLSNNGEYRWAYNRLFRLNNTLKTFKSAIKEIGITDL